MHQTPQKGASWEYRQDQPNTWRLGSLLGSAWIAAENLVFCTDRWWLWATTLFHLTSTIMTDRWNDDLWQRMGDILQKNVTLRLCVIILVLKQLNDVLEKQIVFLFVPVVLSKSLKLIFYKFYVCSRYLWEVPLKSQDGE